MERKTERILSTTLALVLTSCMQKSQPIVGRDVVSPVIQRYGEAVRRDMEAEWGGLTQEQRDAKEACLAGFSCTEWDKMNEGKDK